MDIAQLEQNNLEELRQMARDAGIQRFSRLKKPDLILSLMRADAERRGLKLRGGVLEISHDGVGFLRAEKYLPGPNDIYVAQAQIKRFNLRTGDMVIGQVRPPKDNEKYYGLLRVDAVNGVAPDENKPRVPPARGAAARKIVAASAAPRPSPKRMPKSRIGVAFKTSNR